MSRIQGGELRKQISIFLPISDWRLLRAEAAVRQVAVTELAREALAPTLRRLREEEPDPDGVPATA